MHPAEKFSRFSADLPRMKKLGLEILRENDMEYGGELEKNSAAPSGFK